MEEQEWGRHIERQWGAKAGHTEGYAGELEKYNWLNEAKGDYGDSWKQAQELKTSMKAKHWTRTQRTGLTQQLLALGKLDFRASIFIIIMPGIIIPTPQRRATS